MALLTTPEAFLPQVQMPASPAPAPAAPAAPAAATSAVPQMSVESTTDINGLTVDPAIAALHAQIVAATPGSTPADPAAVPAADPAAPAVPPVVEPAPEAAPAGPSAAGWAAVKEAEKALRESRKQFELDQMALRKQQSEMQQQTEAAKHQPQITGITADKFKADPFGALRELGVPFEQLAEMVIQGKVSAPSSAPAPAAQPQGEVEQLKQQVQQLTQFVQNQQAQTGLQVYQGKMRDLMATPEYELVAAYPRAVDEAVDLASKYHATYGKVLTPSEALGMIQDSFKEQLSQLQSHAAVRKTLGLVPAAPSPASAPPVAQPSSGPRTINNNMATPPTPQVTPAQTIQDPTGLLLEIAKNAPAGLWSGE